MPDKIPSIGDLDKRIEIQSPVESRTPTGGVVVSDWECVARCWAGVSSPLTGNSQDVLADQIVATTRVLFTIRYRDGLDKKMRILYRGQYYDMLPPFQEVGRRQFLTIQAQVQE